jgi:hypothetical protein
VLLHEPPCYEFSTGRFVRSCRTEVIAREWREALWGLTIFIHAQGMLQYLKFFRFHGEPLSAIKAVS